MIKKLARVLSLPMGKLYLSAHPDLPEFLEYDEIKKRIAEELAPALNELKEDKALRTQHHITDSEIEELATMKLRGEIKAKEDYVFLLLSIRQVLR